MDIKRTRIYSHRYGWHSLIGTCKLSNDSETWGSHYYRRNPESLSVNSRMRRIRCADPSASVPAYYRVAALFLECGYQFF